MSWHVAGPQAEAAAVRRAVGVTLLAAVLVLAVAVLAGCGSRLAGEVPGVLDIQFGLKSSSPQSAPPASALPVSPPSPTPPVALPGSVSPQTPGTDASSVKGS